ncbi:hypothetical protein AQUCO_02000038v1 [Aquilegia coerulea]|uniref:Protein kinase domain-containing protein n=1 Tax=Aquilegia coerulea TaxID=218851 RepID=A0A2G5DFM3_AQUCA|nr:hypothetical protein AQUCO_02000038v1 [Aquilegia coerulea]
MALLVIVLMLLVPLQTTSVTNSVILSKVCGDDLLTYSSSSEHESFYINEVAVDKYSFCRALKFYNVIGVFSATSLGGQGGFDTYYCELDASPAMMPQKAGRKVLLSSEEKESNSENIGQKGHPRTDNHGSISLAHPKIVGMAAPGMFILCCSLLCPCFRSRKKEPSRAILTNNSSSMDSVPSTLMEPVPSAEANSGNEKIPGSPLRVPGSPHRMQGTPFRVPPSPSRFSMSPQLNRIGSVHLNMSQVFRATQNFSPSLVIGEGGFGTVYKAQLPDGQVVAIKRAKKEHINTLHAEFSSEVELLAKIEHRNLVRLLGYVEKGNERIIITENVPNGTLREHLDEKQIIHRDVKSSNILLTESMRAKVADFGFARTGPAEDGETHILTKVKGTAGYLDPEYLRTYQLTPKSDVYSFGILIIEILSGRRPVDPRKPVDERVTVRWAFKNYNEGNVIGLLDPLMNEVVDARILSKMFSLAFQCAAPTRQDRPNMKEVGEQLWKIRTSYRKSVRRE